MFGKLDDRIKELIESYAAKGREARSSLSHLHTNGSTSFANTRDEFEIKHGREPGGFELFDITHKTKDGTYPDNTNTKEFINMAKSKIEVATADSKSSKTRHEIEKEVFDELMYDKNETNQRPVGYGFGVKRSDVFGVNSLLRKRVTSVTNNGDQKLREEFARHKEQNAKILKGLTSHMSFLVNVVRQGHVSNEILDATNLALREIHHQGVDSTSNEFEARDGSNNSDSE